MNEQNTTQVNPSTQPEFATYNPFAIQPPDSVRVNVNPATDDDASILDHVVDVGKGVLKGGVDAVNSTLDLGYSGLKFAEEVSENGWEASSFDDEKSPLRIPEFEAIQPEYLSGNIAAGISQFAVPYMGIGKLAKLAGIGSKATTFMGRLGQETAKGGVVDFVSTRADAENFLNYVSKTYPEVGDILPDFLKNDGTDPHITKRLTNVLEGAGMGLVTDIGLESTVKLLKAARSAIRLTKEADVKADLAKQGINPETVKLEHARKTLGVEQPAKSVEVEKVTAKATADEIINKLDDGTTTYKELDKEDLNTLFEECEKAPKTRERLISDPNFHTFAISSREGRAFLLATSRLAIDNLDNTTPKSFYAVRADVKELNEKFGFDFEKTIGVLESATDANKAATTYVAQLVPILSGICNNAGQLANKLLRESKEPNGMRLTDKVEFIRMYKDAKRLYTAHKNLGTSQARGLNFRKLNNAEAPADIIDGSGNIDITKVLSEIPDLKDPKAIDEWLNAEGIKDKDILAVAETVQKANGNPSVIFSTLKAMSNASWSNYLKYFYVNNILSGIHTHLLNVGGMTVRQLTEAFGRVAGGAMVSLSKGDKRDFMESLYYLQGNWLALREGITYAFHNLRTNGARFDLFPERISADSKIGSSKFDDVALMAQNPTSLENIQTLLKGKDKELTYLGNLVSHALYYIAAPARTNSYIMRTEDEFFKQINFRAQMHASIRRQLEELNTSKEEWAKSYEKLKKTYFTDNGLVNVDNPSALECLQLADRVTFNQQINSDAVRFIERFANQHLLAKIVVPFVRTVWNTQVDALHHAPFLNFASKSFRDDLAAGGVRQQAALGRMAIGTIAMGCAFYAAMSDRLTGSFSSDAGKRDAQERAGKTEYAIRIDDKWIKYDRADPFGMLLGTTANIITAIQDDRSKNNEKFMYALFGAWIDSVTSKSFITGLVDFFKVFDGEGKTGEEVASYGARTLGGFMPASGFVNSMTPWLFRGEFNTITRSERPRNLYERILSTPYGKVLQEIDMVAEALPPNYDWLTGKPKTSSRYFSEVVNDPVIQEMARDELADHILSEPRPEISGVELTTAQFNEYKRLIGTIKIGGKTLHETLTDLVESHAYDKNRERYLDAEDGAKGFRAIMLRKVCGNFRKAASVQMLKNDPKLMEDVREAKAQEAKDRSKRPVESPLAPYTKR
jgi:hypothetical protein